MTLRESFRGRWGAISLVVLADGSCPAADFMRELDSGDKAKLKALFERFADHGFISNREKFRKVDVDLFEFKSFQIRLFCFLRKRQAIVTHGIKKKRDDLKPADLVRAIRIKSEYDAFQEAASKTGKKK